MEKMEVGAGRIRKEIEGGKGAGKCGLSYGIKEGIEWKHSARKTE